MCAYSYLCIILLRGIFLLLHIVTCKFPAIVSGSWVPEKFLSYIIMDSSWQRAEPQQQLKQQPHSELLEHTEWRIINYTLFSHIT